MNWTEIYNDAVFPRLDWTPPDHQQDNGGMCEVARWHTANCPSFQDAVLEVEHHDDKCESFFVEGAYAWTECGCETRARAEEVPPYNEV